MTEPAPTSARALARGAGVAATWLITGGLNVVAVVCAVFLWAAWLTGSYQSDHDLLDNGGAWLTFMALVGAAACLASAVVDGVAVRLRWMPLWTLAVPAVLLLTMLVAYGATASG